MAVITGDKIWISKWASGNVTSLAACVIFVISASAHQTQISEPVKTKKPPPSRCLTPTILGGLISEPEPELRGEGGGALANMCLLHTLITSGVNTLLMWWPHEPHPLQSLLVNFHQTLRPGKTLPQIKSSIESSKVLDISNFESKASILGVLSRVSIRI